MRKTLLIFAICCLAFASSRLCHGRSSAYEIFISRGVAHLNEGAYDEALESFREALIVKPGDFRALYYSSVCRNRRGKHKEAAVELENIVEADPCYKKARLELGVAYFGIGDYARAVEELLEAEKAAPGDSMTVYYLGRGLLGEGRYDEAVAAFEKARNLDSFYEDVCHYYTGVAMQKKGDNDAAMESFKGAISLAGALPEVISAAREKVKGLPRKEKKRFWRAYVGTRYEYDSNVVLLPYDESLVVTPGKGDFRFTVEPSLEFMPPLGKHWETRHLFTFIQSVHHELGAYNLQGYRICNTAKLKSDYLQPFVGYEYEYYFLDNNKQDYLRSQTVLGGVDIPGGRYAFSRICYTHSIEDFFLPYVFDCNNRDANNDAVGISQYFFAPRWPDSFALLGFYWDHNDARGRNYFYDGYRFLGELSTPVAMGLNFDFIAELYLRDFKHHIIGREDERQSYLATLSRRLNEYVEVGLQYRFANNNSTMAYYQYDRHIFSLIAEMSF